MACWKWPAMARATTAACRWATSRLSTPPGRSTSAIVASAAAGSSTTSSTPWQSTTSALAGPATSSRVDRSPCWPVTRSATRHAALAGPPVEGGEGVGAGVDDPDPVTELGDPDREAAGAAADVEDVAARSPTRPSRTGRRASQTTAVRAALRRSLAGRCWSLTAAWSNPSAIIPALPGLRCHSLRATSLVVLAGRLDVGVRRHLEAAGVHQHPAPAHAAGGALLAGSAVGLPIRGWLAHHRPGGPRLRGAGDGLLPHAAPMRQSPRGPRPSARAPRGPRRPRWARPARRRTGRAAPSSRSRAGRPRAGRYAAARRAPPAARSGRPWRRRGPGRPRRTSRRPGRWRRRGSGR